MSSRNYRVFINNLCIFIYLEFTICSTYHTKKENDMRSELSIFLEKLRGKTSLRRAAELSGLSHAYIRDLELGINRSTKTPIIPSPDTLKALAKAYNYSYANLLKIAGIIDWKKEAESEVNEAYNRLSEDKKKIVDDLIKALIRE